MPRRGENIYKRKDGRWEGRYIKQYDGIIEKCIDICYNRILHLQDGNFLMSRIQSGKVNSWI